MTGSQEQPQERLRVRWPWRKRMHVWVEPGHAWGYWNGPSARYLYLGRFMVCLVHRVTDVPAEIAQRIAEAKASNLRGMIE